MRDNFFNLVYAYMLQIFVSRHLLVLCIDFWGIFECPKRAERIRYRCEGECEYREAVGRWSKCK
jgi:hypothetical protein